jgi:serine/threonine-protein kinase
MSPEQAAGKSADKRCDVWSFGVVLWEMLTGGPLFSGETISHVLADVLKSDPDWNRLPASLPPAIPRLLRRCLTRSVKERLRDIGEARIIIDKVLGGTAEESAAPAASTVTPQALWRRALPWAAMALLAVVAILAVWKPWQAPATPGVIRLSADFGSDGNLYLEYGSAVILSPDGTHIAFVATDAGGKRQIYVRPLDQLQARALPGTEGVRDPFFSPDGQWVAFFAEGRLKKISVQGGAAVTVCDSPDDRGGAWGEDGTIIFTSTTRVGLSQVSSAGGKPEPFSTLDAQAGEVTHRWAQFLPGGKAVLFTSSANGINYEDSDIMVQVRASGQHKKLFHGGYGARYLPSGQVVFVHDGTLFAAPFDLQKLEFSGQAVPVLEGVASEASNGGAQFSFVQSGAQAGMFAYVAGKTAGERFVIDWLTRDGKLTPLRQKVASYWSLASSPDGKLLAMGLEDNQRQDVWVEDWQRDTATRLTFGDDNHNFPAWTPDGKRISYMTSERGAAFSINWKRADGSGDALRLVETKNQLVQMAWHPSGKVLAFTQNNPGTGLDIMTLNMEGDEKTGWKPGAIKPFLNTPTSEIEPAFSPDGRWLAYASSESGEFEVFVCPFPGPGGKWQISTGGGRHAQWAPKGGELFYLNGERTLMTVRYTSAGESFQPGTPEVWTVTKSAGRGVWQPFAPQPDGKRMAVIEEAGGAMQGAINKVNFIVNFPEELRRKLSASGAKPGP